MRQYTPPPTPTPLMRKRSERSVKSGPFHAVLPELHYTRPDDTDNLSPLRDNGWSAHLVHGRYGGELKWRDPETGEQHLTLAALAVQYKRAGRA